MKAQSVFQILLLLGIFVSAALFLLNVHYKEGCPLEDELARPSCMGPRGYFYTIFDYELDLQLYHILAGLLIGIAAGALARKYGKLDTLSASLLAAFLFVTLSLVLIAIFPFWVVY